MHRRLGFLTAAVASAAATALTCAPSASAATGTKYPVNYDFAAGALAGSLTPNTPPAGANDWTCKLTAVHPEPVVLVNGTLANMHDNWGAAAPLLANHGYCVYTFNYGGPSPDSPVQSTGEIAASAEQLEGFTDTVLNATGAAKVDLVGHSQGGMMPRYYLKNLGGAAKVDKLVGLAPSNNGTTLDGITELARQFGLLAPIGQLLDPACTACTEQLVGSKFLTDLNAGGETLPGVDYTVIETKDDEVVTPYTNAFLPAAPNVRNITVQNQCALDASDHLEIAADPIAMADVLNAPSPSPAR
jgi:triacylglycerol esterase/lipase EstA (alpha/beta hydrolase family)